MKNVLFAALIGAVATTTTWAQTPEARPAPVAPTPQVAMAEVMRTVTQSVRSAAPAVPAVVTPLEIFHLMDQAPPATPPAQPAAPAPPNRAAVPATPAPPAPPAPVTAVQAPRYPNPPRNVRFEIVITETGITKPSTKTVSLTVNDGGGSGSVRNGAASASLNVDVRGVQAFEGGAVRAAINVEYHPHVPDSPAPVGGIQSSITSMFQDGRRIQILQTADPLSDRRTTIEVTMTVLK